MKVNGFRVAVFVVFCLSGLVFAAGFSAGPSEIVLDGVLAGSSVSRTLVLGGDDNVSLNVSSGVTGDVASWSVLAGISNGFVLPPGETRLRAVFSVPEGVEPGVYRGRIVFSAFPVESAGSGVGLSFGSSVGCDVVLEVTDQRFSNVRVLGVGLLREQSLLAPVSFDVTLVNEGNSESSVTVKSAVLRGDKSAVVSSSEGSVVVGVGLEEKHSLEHSGGLPASGDYLLNVEVLSDGESVYSILKPFYVRGRPTTSLKAKPIVFRRPPKSRLDFWLILLTVFIAAVVYAYHGKLPKTPENGVN